jgi:CBS domain containing-hemolysin-like protein
MRSNLPPIVVTEFARGDVKRKHWKLSRFSAVAGLLAMPQAAAASIFKGETLDAVAEGLCWVVLVIVPIVVIALFWLVHILPEKIAERRNHPQAKAIQCLCLLSLAFGGLLWPLAWLWAYTKPVLHKLAYGTDQGDHGPAHERKPSSSETQSEGQENA